ncbi:hypothetical protein ACFHWW_27335 [Ensifer sp. P24N7]
MTIPFENPFFARGREARQVRHPRSRPVARHHAAEHHDAMIGDGLQR